MSNKTRNNSGMINLYNIFSVYDRNHLKKRNVLVKALFYHVVLTFCGIIVVCGFRILLPPEMRVLNNNEAYQTVFAKARELSCMAIAFVCLFSPLLEETAFRLWCSMKKMHVSISLSAFSYYIFCLLQLKTLNEHIAGIVMSIAFGTIFYFCVKQKSLTLLMRQRNSFFAFAFMMCAIFALFHIINYNVNSENLLFAVVSCIPRFTAAIVYTYLRINAGFIYGCLLHTMNNLFVVALGVLTF